MSPVQPDVPAVTVILPTKRSAPMVRDCLDGLARQDLGRPFEVILIDGWMDDDVAEVAEAYPFVRLVRSDENLLQARARNIGAQLAKAPYLAFIDADCVPEPGWLRDAVASLDEGLRLVGGPIADALPDNPYAVADNYLQFAELPASRPEGPHGHFPGCNMALRKQDFLEAGGFPHTGVPAGEDTLLCLAIANRYDADLIRFRPAMCIRHRGRDDRATYLDHQRFFGSVRAGFSINLSPLKRTLGRSRWMMPFVAVARLRYMLGCTVRWAPHRLPRMLRLLPLISLGLWHWARGFREGCLKAVLDAPVQMDQVQS